MVDESRIRFPELKTGLESHLQYRHSSIQAQEHRLHPFLKRKLLNQSFTSSDMPQYQQTRRRPRKLVLCFDGTGNKFHGDDSDSNILKIFRMLDRTADDQCEEQLSFSIPAHERYR